MVIAYFSVTLFVQSKLQTVKAEVLEENPEITSVESINRLGHWGEFFTEYVLVVNKEGDKQYRVWTFGDGEIKDEIEINE